jgi:hypothetical protein
MPFNFTTFIHFKPSIILAEKVHACPLPKQSIKKKDGKENFMALTLPSAASK